MKANQRNLHNVVKSQFSTAFEDEDVIAECQTTEKGHGREETRIVFQIKADLLQEIKNKWPSIQTFIAVERHRKTATTNVVDTKFYLSSMDIDPELLNHSIREHWRIETSLHWVLDMVYKEDACRVAEKKSAENLAMFRRVALNLAKLETSTKNSMKGKLKCACWSDDYRSKLFFG